MTRAFRISSPEPWQAQVFAAKSHVVRRSVSSVEREIGRDALELEVRKRGFHLIESAGQFIIICSSEPMHILC